METSLSTSQSLPASWAGGFCNSGRLSLASLTFCSFVVDEERGDFVGGEELAAFEEAELYEEGDAGHDAAGVLDELAHSARRAAGGEEIVDDEDASAMGYGVGVYL